MSCVDHLVDISQIISLLGLSRDYWMDDQNAKECYDCKSVFTTWRRKHHCRICGKRASPFHLHFHLI